MYVHDAAHDATRKGWPLEGVGVRLTHDRIHAEDCADCESTSGLIDTVDRTLTNEIQIRTRLLDAAVVDVEPAVP